VTKGETWVVEMYETSSPTTGWLVLCVEVKNGFGLRMGWTFLKYRPDKGMRVMEIPELFVWPTFRRMGIGRFLEREAVKFAAKWGCGEIHLMMNEADSVVGPPRSAARLFAQAVGYEWRWRPEVAPRRPATAIKRLDAAV
jgi:GNAT superfamily N-acetyltransferase